MEEQVEREEVRTCSSPARPKVMAPKTMSRFVLGGMVDVVVVVVVWDGFMGVW